jgi:hypothetical protein
METFEYCKEFVFFPGSLNNFSEIMHFERLIKQLILTRNVTCGNLTIKLPLDVFSFSSCGTPVMSRSSVLIRVMDMIVKRIQIFETGY